MIKKERNIPLKIRKLEALLRRIPSDHSNRVKIEDELGKSYAGFRGEQSLDYYLTFLPQEEYMIFHDLRLPYKDDAYFQIDSLILSRRFFLILEVKNISGTLFFDQAFHQLIRTSNDKEESFPDPILQTNRQKIQLESWMRKNNFSPIPIASFIAFSNPSTIIKTATNHHEVFQKVIHAAALPVKVETLHQEYKKEIITIKELNKISRFLLNQHTEFDTDILKRFGIQKTEIITGVHCPDCLTLPLLKERGGWYCPQCASTYKNAYIQTLFDYSLLISPTITNLQCREFLQLQSISIASKLLCTLSLPYSGTYRNREYVISSPELQKRVIQ